VAKFDPSGARLVYLTYLGGSGSDTATGLAVDSSGNAYIAGFTTSRDFPTQNALQPNNRGQFNGFVTKLGPAGNLVYSTYLGGTVNDSASGIAVDASGNAYVAGIATSPNFPTVNALQPNLSGAAITVDPSGDAFVTGFTESINFPTAAALQPEFGGGGFDAFIAKLNPSGTALEFSTYLGGSGTDSGFGIVASTSNSAYAIGLTGSGDFATMDPIQPGFGGGTSDVFMVRIRLGPTITGAEIKGKHLNITESGFEQGAVILMDGAQQKTLFKSGSSLRGKKVGRKINPGQTVRLQVRNPDGTVSSDFSFTRAAR
jgi:hypothetical protein